MSGNERRSVTIRGDVASAGVGVFGVLCSYPALVDACMLGEGAAVV